MLVLWQQFSNISRRAKIKQRSLSQDRIRIEQARMRAGLRAHLFRQTLGKQAPMELGAHQRQLRIKDSPLLWTHPNGKLSRLIQN